MIRDGYAPHDVGWTPEKVGRVWDYFASNPSYGPQFFSAHAGRAIVERLDREPGLRGKRVLDFGCGRGDLLAHLFARGIQARGLEFSEAAVAETAARFAGEPLFLGVELTRLLPSPLPDGSFNAILLVEVVEHLLDDQLDATLAEVHRLLAPGGHVLATAPNGEDLGANLVHCPDCGATFHRWQHVRSLTPASIAALFESHGFESEHVEALFWGLSGRARVRTRLRHPRTRMSQPHLLYAGRRRG